MKNILITGSTDGIGKLAAVALASKGHAIYMHGRSQEKLDQAIADVKEQSKNESIEGFIADLSDFESIHDMIEQVNSSVERLDVLINNAGVLKTPVAKNNAGYDLRFMVNYIAPYVLTSGLLSLLNKTDEARVINLSSAAQAQVDLDALAGKKDISEFEAYSQSKLALTMWSFDFAHKHPNVNAIAVNPGSLLQTAMVKEAFGQHQAPASKGADILYELAVSPEYADKSGKYFDNDIGSFGSAHPSALDEAAIDNLIKATDEVIAAGQRPLKSS